MKPVYFQQGDVIIKPIGTFGVFTQEFEKIPAKAKPLKGNLVLKGNTNSHALYGGKFKLLNFENTLFIKVEKETTLDHVKDHRVAKPKHAEHHAQKLPKGEYFLSPLSEYDHQKEEKRQVID